jgi:hypothetical protein
MSTAWPWSEDTRKLMVGVLGSVKLEPTKDEVDRLFAYVPDKGHPAELNRQANAIRNELEAYAQARGYRSAKGRPGGATV